MCTWLTFHLLMGQHKSYTVIHCINSHSKHQNTKARFWCKVRSHHVMHFAFSGIQNTSVGEMRTSLVVLLPNPFCWHLNLFPGHLGNLNKWQKWLMGFNSTLCPASKSLTKYNLARALWWMSTLLIDCGLCPFIYSKPLISNSFSNILKIKML